MTGYAHVNILYLAILQFREGTPTSDEELVVVLEQQGPIARVNGGRDGGRLDGVFGRGGELVGLCSHCQPPIYLYVGKDGYIDGGGLREKWRRSRNSRMQNSAVVAKLADKKNPRASSKNFCRLRRCGESKAGELQPQRPKLYGVSTCFPSRVQVA